MKIFDVTKMTPLQLLAAFIVLLIFFTIVAGSVLNCRIENNQPPNIKSTRVVKIEDLNGNRYCFMANGDTLLNCTARLSTIDGKNVVLCEGDSVSYQPGKTECIVYPFFSSLYRFVCSSDGYGNFYNVYLSPIDNPFEQSSSNCQNSLNFAFSNIKEEDMDFFLNTYGTTTSYSEFPKELFVVGDTFVIVTMQNEREGCDFYNQSLRRIMKSKAQTSEEPQEAVVLARSKDIIRLDNQTCIHRPNKMSYDFDKAAIGDTVAYSVNQSFKSPEKQLVFIKVK